jgi:hypothetical protein
MAYLSPTERMRCIEGYDEHVREQAENNWMREAISI